MTSPQQPQSKGKDSLRLRLLSTAIGLPLLLILILSRPIFTLALAAAAVLLGLLELFKLAGIHWQRPPGLLGLCIGLILLTAGWQGQPALLGTLALLSPLALLLAHRWTPQAFRPWVLALASPLYLGATLAHAVMLRRAGHGIQLLLLALLTTFAVDTAAYFVGRTLGRHKMAPKISPGKTWEGAVGGLIGGVLFAVALTQVFNLPFTLWQSTLLGSLIAVVGQAGDLMESALKRAHQAKDAGALIPGHGGILDRLDSVVYNLVLVYHFSMWGIS